MRLEVYGSDEVQPEVEGGDRGHLSSPTIMMASAPESPLPGSLPPSDSFSYLVITHD